jgi:hypothetical protein
MIALRTFAVGIILMFNAITSLNAQTTFDCQSIARSTPRLACYDKLTPPIKQTARITRKRDQASGNPYASENARIKRLFAPICRNC